MAGGRTLESWNSLIIDPSDSRIVVGSYQIVVWLIVGWWSANSKIVYEDTATQRQQQQQQEER